MASPPGGSTLITSAPRSASTSRGERPGDERREVDHLQAREEARSRVRSARASTPPAAPRPAARRPAGAPTTGVASTTSSWPRSDRRRARPTSARWGSASASPGPSTGSAAMPASRSARDPGVARPGGEDRPPALRPLAQGAGGLVGVVALAARLVAQDLEELGVHALAAEPDLQQLAVGAAVEEVGERRALLPVPLDLGRRPLGPADHAAERGEHAVVERRLGPAAVARERPATQQGEHRRGEQQRGAGPGRPDVDEDGTRAGAPPAGCRTRTAPRRAARSRRRRRSAVRLGRQRA